MDGEDRDFDLEEQYEAAIDVTREGNKILAECNPDSPEIARRERIVINLQGQLNMLRGFDSVAMGC